VSAIVLVVRLLMGRERMMLRRVVVMLLLLLLLLHIPQVNPLLVLVDILVMWVLHTVHCMRREAM
jgi:hypothetical protein